jgi:hypothetical protein
VKLPVNYDELTQAQRREIRELYCRLQDWKCIHCNNSLLKDATDFVRKMKIDFSLFPGGEDFLKYPIHLHHDHNTGMTIGAVHARCNAILWQYHGE